MEVYFKAIGGASVIGRSCFGLLKKGHKPLVLDCGFLNNKGDGDISDLFSNLEQLGTDIPAIIVSHAHADHVGGLLHFFFEPRFPLHNNTRIYSTEQTKALSLEVTLKETSRTIRRIAIGNEAKYLQEYEESRKRLEEQWHDEPFGKSFCIEEADVQASLLQAGHIPGAACVFLDFGGLTVLYTGDISLNSGMKLITNDSLATLISRIPNHRVDVVITENTYATDPTEDLMPERVREQEHAKFLDFLKQNQTKGLATLVPVYSVGRAQEVVKLISEDAPGLLDCCLLGGTAKDAYETVHKRNRQNLPEGKEVSVRVDSINIKMRCFPRSVYHDTVKDLFGKVIIASSGLLIEGSVSHKCLRALGPERCRVALTGWLGPSVDCEEGGSETIVNGVLKKWLADSGRAERGDINWKVFNLSAHAWPSRLAAIPRVLEAKKVIIVHRGTRAPKERNILVSDLNAHGIEVEEAQEGKVIRL